MFYFRCICAIVLHGFTKSANVCRHWAISAVHCLRGGGVRGRLFVLGEFLKVVHFTSTAFVQPPDTSAVRKFVCVVQLQTC